MQTPGVLEPTPVVVLEAWTLLLDFPGVDEPETPGVLERVKVWVFVLVMTVVYELAVTDEE